MMNDVLYVNVNTNHYANLNIIICMMSQSARAPTPTTKPDTTENILEEKEGAGRRAEASWYLAWCN